VISVPSAVEIKKRGQARKRPSVAEIKKRGQARKRKVGWLNDE